MQIKQKELELQLKLSLKEEDTINIDELSDELFKEEPEIKEDFSNFVKGQGVK